MYVCTYGYVYIHTYVCVCVCVCVCIHTHTCHSKRNLPSNKRALGVDMQVGALHNKENTFYQENTCYADNTF